MHHFRLTLNGAARDVERLSQELEERGATRLHGATPAGYVWSTPEPPQVVEELSARHPRVVLGVERFEAFGDEQLRAIVRGGCATVMQRTPLAPDPYGDRGCDWGLCMDEDGEQLDPRLVRACGELVAAHPCSFTVTTPLASALEAGRQLGGVCAAAGEPIAATGEPVASDMPSARAIAALLDLATVALTIAATTPAMREAESVVARSLILSRACAHAGAETLWDAPGTASWPEWLRLVVESASDLVDAGCHCAIEVPAGMSSVFTEHASSSDEQLVATASGVLVTCLQTLALFEADGCARRSGV